MPNSWRGVIHENWSFVPPRRASGNPSWATPLEAVMPMLDGVVIGTRISDSAVGQAYDVEHTPKGTEGTSVSVPAMENVVKVRAEK